jgi:segregation and condensation protein B
LEEDDMENPIEVEEVEEEDGEEEVVVRPSEGVEEEDDDEEEVEAEDEDGPSEGEEEEESDGTDGEGSESDESDDGEEDSDSDSDSDGENSGSGSDSDASTTSASSHESEDDDDDAEEEEDAEEEDDDDDGSSMDIEDMWASPDSVRGTTAFIISPEAASDAAERSLRDHLPDDDTPVKKEHVLAVMCIIMVVINHRKTMVRLCETDSETMKSILVPAAMRALKRLGHTSPAIVNDPPMFN